MKAIPLETFSSTIVRESLHAVYAMRALLAATDKGAIHLTADDIASLFQLGRPSDDLVEPFRRNAKTAAEAAAIIFIHSTCENAVFQLIELLAQYDPEPWVPNIAKKKVSFEDVASSTAQQIRDRLLKDHLKDVIEKMSFPEKVDRLFAALKPPTVSGVIPDFEFKHDDFKKLDDLRHRLTHEPKFATPIQDAPAKLTYLINTLRLLVKLAEQKYPATN